MSKQRIIKYVRFFFLVPSLGSFFPIRVHIAPFFGVNYMNINSVYTYSLYGMWKDQEELMITAKVRRWEVVRMQSRGYEDEGSKMPTT